MFINTGTRKIKSCLTIDVDYAPNDDYYSRRNIAFFLSDMEIAFNASDECLLKALKNSTKQIAKFFSENDLLKIFLLKEKYNGYIFFSYAPPNKKEKTKKIIFYIIPKNAYGRVLVSYKDSKKPCHNEMVYLKSAVLLPDELVGGKEGEKEVVPVQRVQFSQCNSLFTNNKINVRSILDEIYEINAICSDDSIRGLKTGLYDAEYEGIYYYLYIDKTFSGNEKNPHMALIEYGFYSKEEIKQLLESGVYNIIKS